MNQAVGYLTERQKNERAALAALRSGRAERRGELRVPVTVRIMPEDKALLTSISVDAGLEPGTAARQIIELALRRVRAGADLIDVLAYLKAKPVIRVQADRT